MRIPDEIVERIRSSLDLAEVVSEVVPLKRQGTHLFGLCPFHDEKSPSFSVHPARGRYHCFGCGADGDAIEFVRETRGLDFLEAIEQLAQRTGVKLPANEEMSALERQRMQRLSSMREALGRAQQMYTQALLHRLNTKEDPVAIYCASRGIAPDVAQRFGLGWAQDGATLNMLRGREALGVDAGLLSDLSQSDASPGRTGWKDRLRNRLTFPITDDQGRVIAFGGRIIESGSNAPKYLNTPETDLYKKSEALFRIHDARTAINRSKRAIVVEGYMDALAMAKAGIHEVVACCGTAATDAHLKKLLKWADEIVLLFDGDQAGIRASERTAKLCLQLFQSGKHFRFARIPQGLDPDEWIQTKGVQSLQAVIHDAPELSEQVLRSTADKHRSLASVEDKAAFLQDIKQQMRESGLDSTPFASLLIKQAYGQAYSTGRNQRDQWRGTSLSTHNGTNSGAARGNPGTNQIAPWRSRWVGSNERSARSGDGSLSGVGAPGTQHRRDTTSLWDRMRSAAAIAPCAAAKQANLLLPLLDDQSSEEAEVIQALHRSLDAASRGQENGSTPEDALWVDFLQSCPRLMIKKRRDDAIDALSEMRTRGELTDVEYLESTMRVLQRS